MQCIGAWKNNLSGKSNYRLNLIIRPIWCLHYCDTSDLNYKTTLNCNFHKIVYISFVCFMISVIENNVYWTFSLMSNVRIYTQQYFCHCSQQSTFGYLFKTWYKLFLLGSFKNPFEGLQHQLGISFKTILVVQATIVFITLAKK